jgi:hypothetical protein
MSMFPRTTVGGLSVSRMIIGTNWFAGWSHTGPAKDQLIRDNVPDGKAMAQIIRVFVEAGVDTIMGPITEHQNILAGVKEAEQLTGKRLIKVDTPFPNMGDSPEDRAAAERLLDQVRANDVDICMPHHQMVEQFLDRRARKIHRLGDYTKMIRDRGMIPGLSAHMPEVVMYCDENNEDVETYIQIYNAAGFLMQLEVEFIQRLIHRAKKPVMTIKPMAAGRLTPLVGLTFVWNTIRDCDMVTVGTMSVREAEEVIEYSLAALERRLPEVYERSSPGKGKGTVLDQE